MEELLGLLEGSRVKTNSHLTIETDGFKHKLVRIKYPFTTLNGRKATAIAYIETIDKAEESKVLDELLSFYGCRNSDFDLAYESRLNFFTEEKYICQDNTTGNLFFLSEINEDE